MRCRDVDHQRFGLRRADARRGGIDAGLHAVFARAEQLGLDGNAKTPVGSGRGLGEAMLAAGDGHRGAGEGMAIVVGYATREVDRIFERHVTMCGGQGRPRTARKIETTVDACHGVGVVAREGRAYGVATDASEQAARAHERVPGLARA